MVKNNSHFKVGHPPWNKGIKGVSKPNKGSFRIGAKPPEHKERCKCFRCTKTSPMKGKKLSEDRKKALLNSRSGISWNKGKKTGLIPQTAFKKNHIPHNYIDGRSKYMGPARYGEDWDKTRYIVYKRDKFQCQSCRIKKVRLDVHHKVPFLISRDNSIQNLISLCRKCHMKAEMALNHKTGGILA